MPALGGIGSTELVPKMPGGTAAGLVPVSDGAGGVTWTTVAAAQITDDTITAADINDPELKSIAGLTSAAGKGIRFTGAGTAEVITITDFAKTFLDDADATAVKATLGVGAAATYVTSLPGSPTDGQEIYYAADASNGVVWHLRYRSAASKWDFLGGPPLISQSNTNFGSISNSGYTSSFSGGTLPSLTVPLLGDYDVEIWTGALYVQTSNVTGYMSIGYGGTASDTDSGQTLGSGTTCASVKLTRRKTGLTASMSVTMQGKCTGGQVYANAGSVAPVGISLKPVRIG